MTARRARRDYVRAALMTPGEVAAAFRVDPKTVTRWANAGRIRVVKTPGGHRRFYREDVERLLARDCRP